MKIIACGSVPTIIAPEKYFTGRVLQTPIIETEAPARLRATMVGFEPGARTHWHTHPLGQTLYVTSGAGRAQTGMAGTGDQGRRRHLVRAGRKALARCRPENGDDAYRHAGGARRRPRRLVGKGHRRAIWRLSATDAGAANSQVEQSKPCRRSVFLFEHRIFQNQFPAGSDTLAEQSRQDLAGDEGRVDLADGRAEVARIDFCGPWPCAPVLWSSLRR